jgi:nitrite reductase/ring-hydroxylating ferredoxin subunit
MPPDFFRAASLADLQSKQMLTVSGADRLVLLCWSEDRVFALDSRCPHMGFPLSKGSLKEGILTCHWHHAQFDLKSGCAFDLWADDVQVFEVRIDGDEVWVAKRPKQDPGTNHHEKRLRWGLEQNIGLIQAKSIVALLALGEETDRVVRKIAEFAARNHQVWGDGLTTLTIVARIAPFLESETLVYAMAKAARRVAENCSGQPARRAAGGLNGERFEEARLRQWLFHWARVRQDDGAERTIIAALDSGLGEPALNRIIFGAIQERIYADAGHALDQSNKGFELLESIGWDNAAEILPLLTQHITQTRSEEEGGAWRVPIDLTLLIRKAEEELQRSPYLGLAEVRLPENFYFLLLESDPVKIIEEIRNALLESVPGAAVAEQLALAAAWRLACFPESNDIDDWFAPVHTFSFCNALYQVLSRGETGHTVERGLLHAAMSIYIDRFLNIPSSKLPAEAALEPLPTSAGNLLTQILSTLDQRTNWNLVPALVMRYLRLGHPEKRLIDTLVFATVREDLDFHKLQVLEAAITQAQNWPPGSGQRELFYVAAARHLAAHCPTRRSSGQSVTVALRLHRGEALEVIGE